MHIRIGIVLGLLLALGVAGCGDKNGGDKVATAGGQRSATSSAKSDGLSGQEQALKFAQCIRDNGVPNFPDPKTDSKEQQQLVLPDGVDSQKLEAAQHKCKQYQPNGGGELHGMDPQMLEQMRKLAQCIRDHGVPDYPDPDPNGNPGAKGNDLNGPTDSTFAAAVKACAKYQPAAPSGMNPQGGMGGTK